MDDGCILGDGEIVVEFEHDDVENMKNVLVPILLRFGPSGRIIVLTKDESISIEPKTLLIFIQEFIPVYQNLHYFLIQMQHWYPKL